MKLLSVATNHPFWALKLPFAINFRHNRYQHMT